MAELKRSVTIQVEITLDQGIELLQWLKEEKNVTVSVREFGEESQPEKHNWVGIDGDNFKKVGDHFEVRLWVSKVYEMFAAEKFLALLKLLDFGAPEYYLPVKDPR